MTVSGPGRQASRYTTSAVGGAPQQTSGPTALRVALGSRLRQLREAAGITREAAGDFIRASQAKISRLELGRVGFRERDVADLLTRYGVTDDDERRQFLELARRANAPGWWQQYNDLLPSWFETYLGLEQAASIIRTYELQFIPGLLQTEDYARAVIRLGHPETEDVHRRLVLRLRRHELLETKHPPRLWAAVDEAALRRPLVGVEQMHDQLRHLITMTERPNISLQVVPFALGGHAAAGGSFSILRFAEADVPDIVYLEQLSSALYLDKRSDVDHYASVMDRLCALIPPPNQTAHIISEIIDGR